MRVVALPIFFHYGFAQDANVTQLGLGRSPWFIEDLGDELKHTLVLG